MSTLDLDAIEARANAATPGPWTAGECPDYSEGGPAKWGWVKEVEIGYEGESPIDDVRFMAHARQDVPALVAEVRRLRVALGLAKVALEDHEDATESIYYVSGPKVRAALTALDELKVDKV